MTSPNKTNIDQWLFDYFEGNLSSEQEALLEEFLLEHPEYDADLEAMGEARVSSGVDYFPHAEALKRDSVWSGAYMQWAAGVALLIGLASSIWWINQSMFAERYHYVPLAENYFQSMENEGNLYDAGTSFEVTEQKKEQGKIVRTQNLNVSQVSKHKSGSSASIQSVNSIYSSGGSAYSSPHLNITSPSNVLSNEISSTTATDENKNSSLSSGEEKNLIHSDEIAAVSNTDGEMVFTNELTNQDGAARGVREAELNSAPHIEPKAKPVHTASIARSVKNFMNSRLGLVNLRDPQYMVPGAVANELNFGHTGSLLATRVYHSTYAQWPGKSGQSFDFITGADSYVHAIRGGLGAQVNYSNYQAGLFQNYEGSITYSPKLRVAKHIVLEPALRFKMGAKQLNADRVTPGQQIEWERGNLRTLYPEGGTPQGERLFYRDFGAGLLLNSKWGFVGVNADNIGRHYNNIYSEDIQNPERSKVFLTITAGTDYESYNKKMSLSMYALYQNYGQLNKAWAGVNYRYRFMTIGGALSTELEPVGSLGITFDHFRLAYVTDYSMNQISGQRMLSHQISLRFVTKPTKHGHKLLN
jgi:type IX secretion system PorP/SprF family membrane protein